MSQVHLECDWNASQTFQPLLRQVLPLELRVMVLVVGCQGCRIQDSITARLGAFVAELAHRYNIFRCFGVLLFAMLNEVFLAGISTSSNAAATLDVTGKGSFVVFIAHVLRICSLRNERFILLLNAARQLLESIGPVVRASVMGAHRKGILEARTRC